MFKTYLKVYYGISLSEVGLTVDFETLCRARRCWQSQGKYQPFDGSIAETRHNAEKDYRGIFSKKITQKQELRAYKNENTIRLLSKSRQF